MCCSTVTCTEYKFAKLAELPGSGGCDLQYVSLEAGIYFFLPGLVLILGPILLNIYINHLNETLCLNVSTSEQGYYTCWA